VLNALPSGVPFNFQEVPPVVLTVTGATPFISLFESVANPCDGKNTNILLNLAVKSCRKRIKLTGDRLDTSSLVSRCNASPFRPGSHNVVVVEPGYSGAGRVMYRVSGWMVRNSPMERMGVGQLGMSWGVIYGADRYS
jgi:hypothetical protein